MSGKQSKRLRQKIRREMKHHLNDIVNKMGFKDRLMFAWAVVRGKVHVA